MGEKDDYDSENSWILDGLPSSSTRYKVRRYELVNPTFKITLLKILSLWRGFLPWFNPGMLRTEFFGEYQSEILSHPTCKTHRRMNEISRKFPEFSRSVKKGLGGREQVRHGASEVGNGCWNPRAVYIPGSVQQHLSHDVRCHWMTGKEVGLGCVSVATVWLFCDVLRPECQNYDGRIEKFSHSEKSGS